jgi:hypothetical protein
MNPEDNHAVAGINVDEVAVITEKHLGAINVKNAKKITEDKTAVNKVLDEFDVSRHGGIKATVVDGNKDVGDWKHLHVVFLRLRAELVNVEVGDITDGECNQHVDMEGMQSNQY